MEIINLLNGLYWHVFMKVYVAAVNSCSAVSQMFWLCKYVVLSVSLFSRKTTIHGVKVWF